MKTFGKIALVAALLCGVVVFSGCRSTCSTGTCGVPTCSTGSCY